MNVVRGIVFLIGLAVLVAAAWLLFTTTPVAGFVPQNIALVAVLIIVGLAIMGAAAAFGGDHDRHEVEHRHDRI